MSALRLGSVPYLNAAPLIEGILADPAVSLDLAVPSALAARWRGGAFDAALVPVADALLVAEARFVRAGAIGADGRCESVKLFHRLPLGRVRTIALDRESITSNALLRLLAKERFGLSPGWLVPSDGDPWPPPADAFLSIGDKSFHVHPRLYEAVDLGEAWKEWTGLPFVFAAWVTPGTTAPDGLARKLEASLSEGRRRLPEIARREAAKLRLDEAFALRYLRDCIRYELDDRAVQGLTRFCDLARGQALLPSSAEPRFLG